MRSFVLPFVALAVVALVVALYVVGSSGGGAERKDAVGPEAAAPTAVQPDPAASDLRPTGAARPANVATAPVERAPATAERAPETTRAAVESGIVGAWSNGVLVHVQGPDGAPLANASVELRDDSAALFSEMQMVLAPEQGKAPTLKRARTDAKGAANFENLAPGRYAAAAVHPDFARGEVAGIQVLETGVVETRIALASGLSLEGRVTDQGGAPIADATLTLVPTIYSALAPDNPHYIARAAVVKTDAGGRYRFDKLEAGSRSLTAWAPGYGSRTQQNVLILERGDGSGPLVQDFALDPGFRIAGVVLSPDRKPIEGAEVQALNYASAQTSMGRARTGRDGKFELVDLAPGTYHVIARAQGWKEWREPRVEAGTLDVELVLGELGGVTGRVTAAATGEPVSVFEVNVRRANPGTGALGRVERRQPIDHPAGEYQLLGLDEGEYVLEFEAVGFARTPSARFRVEQGIVTPQIDVALTRGGTLVGRVVHARTGEPLSGARVTTLDANFVRNPFTEMLGALQPRATTQRTVRTDADGRFRLELLTPENYQLEVEHQGLVTQQVKDLQVVDGSETIVADVRLSPGAIVRGTVTDASGQPMPGAKVTLIGAAGPSYNELADVNGRYTVRQVAPGNYRVSAQRPIGNGLGGAVDPFTPILDIEKTKRDVFVAEGSELNVDFRIGS